MKRLLSLCTAFFFVIFLASLCVLSAEAAYKTYPRLTNPDITAKYNSEHNAYIGIGSEAVPNSSSLRLEWDFTDADHYQVAVKMLYGEPDTGENEDGAPIKDFDVNYSKTYYKITLADMQSAAGKWIKVYLKCMNENDEMIYNSKGYPAAVHYYFYVEPEKAPAPTLDLRIGSQSFGNGEEYGPFVPGDICWLELRTTNAHHVYRAFEADASQQYVFNSDNSDFRNGSWFGGASVSIPQGCAPGLYTITVKASNSSVNDDPNAEIVTKTLKVRVIGSPDTAVPDTGSKTDSADFRTQYPNVFDFHRLEKTFDSKARSCILEEYQEYVLRAIEYHIENSEKDRVAKNLIPNYLGVVNGNAVFFFDGVSVNLLEAKKYNYNIAEKQASGYVKSDNKTYNTSAVCIVVRLDDEGYPVVVFADKDSSTMPDQVRIVKEKYKTENVSCLKDGIYSIEAGEKDRKTKTDENGITIETKAGYAAFSVNYCDSVPGIRAHLTDNTKLNTTTNGIMIHKRYWDDIDSTVSQKDKDGNNLGATSTGCLIVGKRPGESSQYDAFIEATTGLSNGSTKRFRFQTTSFGITQSTYVGCVIVDRSCYKKQIAFIYGDDTRPDGYKAQEIADALTAASDQWHKEIEAQYPSARTDDNDSLPFRDVTKYATINGTVRYYDAVRYVYERGLMRGTSGDEFSPDTSLTRAMFVTVLGRMTDNNIENDRRYQAKTFDDVPLNEGTKWYFPYVNWAKQNKIVKGYDEYTFGPNDTITMEQAAVILANYAKYLGYRIDVDQNLNIYSDWKSISPWAFHQVAWALDTNIYVYSGTKLSPQAPTTRAILAQMLYAFESRYD